MFLILLRIHFKRVVSSHDITNGTLSYSVPTRIKRVGIKTRSNGTVRSGLNKIQNLWKTREEKKKNERRADGEEERAAPVTGGLGVPTRAEELPNEFE